MLQRGILLFLLEELVLQALVGGLGRFGSLDGCVGFDAEGVEFLAEAEVMKW